MTLREKERKQEAGYPSKLCVAGSSLLPELIEFARIKHPKLDLTKFKPSDADVFLLGSSVPKHRVKSIVNVDLVEVPDENPIDLLLGFDLPCCPVATDSDMMVCKLAMLIRFNGRDLSHSFLSQSSRGFY